MLHPAGSARVDTASGAPRGEHLLRRLGVHRGWVRGRGAAVRGERARWVRRSGVVWRPDGSNKSGRVGCGPRSVKARPPGAPAAQPLALGPPARSARGRVTCRSPAVVVRLGAEVLSGHPKFVFGSRAARDCATAMPIAYYQQPAQPPSRPPSQRLFRRCSGRLSYPSLLQRAAATC